MTDDPTETDAPVTAETDVTLPVADTASETAVPMEASGDGPDWSSYPTLMSPQQIAQACSISDAQARMNGKREYYGDKHKRMSGRKELTYYERDKVEAYYRSQTEPQTFINEPSVTGVPMGNGAASLIKALDTIARKSEAETLNAATIETSAATIARLVRQNEKLMDRVGELERMLREASEQWEPVMFGLFRKKR